MMPLDDTNWPNNRYNNWKSRCIGWQLRFCWFPKKCHFSNKSLWLSLSYKGTAMWTGPGDPAYEYLWVDRKEFVFQRLKGTV